MKMMVLFALLVLLALPCFAQVPGMNNQSSYTSGNVTVNLGNGQATIQDNGGHVIVVTVTADPRVDLMREALTACSAAIGSITPTLQALSVTTLGGAVFAWKTTAAATLPQLIDAKAKADVLLPPP